MDKTEKNESCSTDEPLASKSESEANGIREEKGKSRKANKPLMERRRRERINNCLEQLKTFLMDATKKESSYYSKLEKADILEMTVKYLKNLKRQQMTVANHTPTPNPPIMDKYIAGFNECTYEVNKYLNSINGISDDVRGRLIGHLADSLHRSNTLLHKPSTCTQTLSSPANPTMPQTVHMQGPIISGTTNKSVCFQTLQSPQLQIVPAKMNSGETIYVLVNAQNIPVLGNPVYQTGHVPVIQNMISPVPVQLGDPQNNNTSTPVCNNSIRNNTTLTSVFNSVEHNNNSISLINNSATPQSTNNAFFDFTLPDNMSPRQMEKNILHSTPNTSLGNCDVNTSSFTNYTPPYYPHTGPILTGIDAENHLVLQQQRQKQESTFNTNRTSAIEIVPAQDNSSVCDSHNTSASSDNSVNSGESSSLNDKGVLPTANQHHKIERYFDLNRPGPSHASMPYLDPMWRPW